MKKFLFLMILFSLLFIGCDSDSKNDNNANDCKSYQTLKEGKCVLKDNACEENKDCKETNQICDKANHECKAKEQTKVCEAKTKRCKDEKHIEICKDDGTAWKELKTCEGENICNTTKFECEEPQIICNAGEKRCEDNKQVQQCKADKTGWETLETCEEAKDCNNETVECDYTKKCTGISFNEAERTSKTSDNDIIYAALNSKYDKDMELSIIFNKTPKAGKYDLASEKNKTLANCEQCVKVSKFKLVEEDGEEKVKITNLYFQESGEIEVTESNASEKTAKGKVTKARLIELDMETETPKENGECIEIETSKFGKEPTKCTGLSFFITPSDEGDNKLYSIDGNYQIDILFTQDSTPIGVYDLTSEENKNYSTCTECVTIDKYKDAEGEGDEIEKQFFQSQGKIEILAGDASYGSKGNIINLKLVEVTINPEDDPEPLKSTPVENGECIEMISELEWDTTCGEGEERCNGNNIETCQADHTWKVKTECKASEECFEDEDEGLVGCLPKED